MNNRHDYEPDIERSAADIFWLLLALVALAAALKTGGGDGTPLAAAPQKELVANAKADEAMEADNRAKRLEDDSSSLRSTPIKLPADGKLRARLVPQAEAKRLVLIVDPRQDMKKI